MKTHKDTHHLLIYLPADRREGILLLLLLLQERRVHVCAAGKLLVHVITVLVIGVCSLKCVSEDILELSHTVAESVIVLTRQWFVFKVVFVPVSRVAVDILHLHNAASTSTLCK